MANCGSRQILARALSHLPTPGSHSVVHLALSGGVDSSVAGFLLREKGYNVRPHLMRCWDLPDAQGYTQCFQQELTAAQVSAQALKLDFDLHVVDLVPEYWNDVFSDVLLAGISAGHTPNPDLACNQRIKFGIFPERLREQYGTDAVIATGHHARLGRRGQNVVLRTGVDDVKDQSYFLASVSSIQLENILMPVGNLRKSEVRELAEYAGLPCAHKTSSRGMCFVGKRPFGQFLNEFFDAKRKAHFVHIDDGRLLGQGDLPVWAYTTGQRARVGGQDARFFVVGCRGEDQVLVAPQGDPRLFTQSVSCSRVDWVSQTAPPFLDDGMEITYKCFSASERRRGRMKRVNNVIQIEFDNLERRVAEGQAVVMYDGDVCLGAAWPTDTRDWDCNNRPQNMYN